MSKQFEPGDQVQDITFDPPENGVVTAKTDKPGVYMVRLDGKSEDVAVRAHNLKKN